jgi:hypothetical protein
MVQFVAARQESGARCRDLWRLECEHLRCQATPKDPIVLGGVVLTMLAVGLVARLLSRFVAFSF